MMPADDLRRLAVGILFALALVACGAPAAEQPAAVPTSTPTPRPTATPTPPPTSTPTPWPTATPMPTATPTAPPTDTPIPTLASVDYQGSWKGKTDSGATIQFTILNKAIAYFRITVNCGSATSKSSSPDRIRLKGPKFHIDNGSYTVDGTFDSLSSASGKLKTAKSDDPCGSALDERWSARFQGPAPLDGNWQGTTSEGSEVSFAVWDGTVVEPTVYFQSCPGQSNLQIMGDVPVADNAFSADVSSDELRLAIEGRFDSNAKASGTVEMTAGKCRLSGAWTAKKR